MTINEQIYEEYCQEYWDIEDPELEIFRPILREFIQQARKEEPRITTVQHFWDWLLIVDENDDMESYYGSDYFDE